MRIISLIAFSFLLFAAACSGDQKKAESKALKGEKKESAKKSSKSPKVDVTSFEASLNKKESKGIRQINKKYTVEINTLREQNKWVGDKNKESRKSVFKRKDAELKALLGEKFETYQAYLKLKKEEKADNK